MEIERKYKRMKHYLTKDRKTILLVDRDFELMTFSVRVGKSNNNSSCDIVKLKNCNMIFDGFNMQLEDVLDIANCEGLPYYEIDRIKRDYI
jgi:hypothetical protein